MNEKPMRKKRNWSRSAVVGSLLLGLTTAPLASRRAYAQEAAPPENVIRTETRLVLVDAVVTDKKGNYIKDLTGKDFRIWEDNKEQTVKTFSFGSDPASPSNLRNRYMVLFFDNSTMSVGDQIQARQAALKFIDSNAGPDRLMAIVNFGGSLQIAQNFTSDAERLKKVVGGVKFSNVDTTGASDVFQLGSASGDFAVRDGIYALRNLSKSLGTIPGRKTLVWLTSGFPINPEVQSEITATIDTCNKANVAIYPVDVRGLVAGMSMLRNVPDGPGPDEPALSARQEAVGDGTGDAIRGYLRLTSFVPPAGSLNAAFQAHGPAPAAPAPSGGHSTSPAPGSSSGGVKSPAPSTGGKTAGTGTGGRATGTGTNGNYNNQNYSNSQLNQARSIIIPPFPTSASDNQQVLYELAQGTGGFVILNTNDLLGGLDKIAKEQNQYYILGYTPSESDEGSCHSLKVKVDHGANVRARTGYCNVKAVDYLAGKSSEKDLENRVAGAAPGTVNASLQAPFFYTSPNVARVNVAMEIPSDSLKFQKEKGSKMHSEMNVLGVAYKSDGTVAAKFSDTVKFDLEKKELESFHEQPVHYEKQFEIASGQYNLKVAFNAGGEQFGKLESPLKIDAYSAGQFSMSSLTLSKEIHPVSELNSGLDAALLEDQVPLIIGNAQIIPAGTSRFSKTDKALVLYGEIYEPKLIGADAQKPPAVAIQMKVLDRKTSEVKVDTGMMRLPIKIDNAAVPFALKIPPEKLTAGAYRIEVKAFDSLNQTYTRTIDFDWD
jgi:VWFA-related protein